MSLEAQGHGQEAGKGPRSRDADEHQAVDERRNRADGRDGEAPQQGNGFWWTCPPIISGFLIGGWRTALLQLIIFVISFLLYFPFIRKVDRLNVVKEAKAEEAADEDW